MSGESDFAETRTSWKKLPAREEEEWHRLLDWSGDGDERLINIYRRGLPSTALY